MDNSKVRILIKDLLENIGEDPKREGLLETPRRVADAYEFLTSGYHKDIEEVMRAQNELVIPIAKMFPEIVVMGGNVKMDDGD